MILSASQAGVSDALRRELSESQPHFLAYLQRSVPGMFPKAYRWIAEMEEIAAFAGDAPAGHEIYDGVAELYRRIAEEVARDPAEQKDLDMLRAFCAPASSGAARKQA